MRAGRSTAGRYFTRKYPLRSETAPDRTTTRYRPGASLRRENRIGVAPWRSPPRTVTRLPQNPE